MTQHDIRQLVISALREILGPACPDTITDQTNPIRHLGLESCDGLDFACTLSEKLDYHIPDHVNPFVDDDRKRARTVGEIVVLTQALLAQRKEKQHA